MLYKIKTVTNTYEGHAGMDGDAFLTEGGARGAVGAWPFLLLFFFLFFLDLFSWPPSGAFNFEWNFDHCSVAVISRMTLVTAASAFAVSFLAKSAQHWWPPFQNPQRQSHVEKSPTSQGESLIYPLESSTPSQQSSTSPSPSSKGGRDVEDLTNIGINFGYFPMGSLAKVSDC